MNLDLPILSGGTSPWLPWTAVLGASLVAAGFDARQRRIPNALTLPLWLTGLAHAAWVSGLAGLGEAVLASVLIALPFVLLFAFAGGGAGDAKMMAGIGAWLGVAQGAIALASVCFAGVVLGLVWAWAQRGLARVASSLHVVAWGLLSPVFGGRSWRENAALLPAVHDDQKMPYGLAILLGVAAAAGIVLLR